MIKVSQRTVAQAAGLNPQHSAERTVDGQAWAASLNEPLPELIPV